MTNKQKLYLIALVSTAMVLMLISIAGAAPFAYIHQTCGSNNVSVIDTATNTVTTTVPVEPLLGELQSHLMEQRSM